MSRAKAEDKTVRCQFCGGVMAMKEYIEPGRKYRAMECERCHALVPGDYSWDGKQAMEDARKIVMHERTCCNTNRDLWGDDYSDELDGFSCSECGEELSGNEPCYCPNCGRKVVR